MDNLKRRFIALGFSMLTASIVSVRASDTQPIEIAAIVSLSGAYSQVGFMEARSLHTAIEIANEHGGVDGRQLTLHLFDDESDTGQAYMLANQIVKAQLASAIVGGSTTPTCEAIHLATGPKHVVQFCLSSAETHGSTYFSSFASSQRSFGDIPAAYMAERRLKRVAIIVRDNHAGSVYDQALETAITAKNLELIQTTQASTTDEAHEATDRALKNRADVIYVGGDRTLEIDVLQEVRRRHKKTTVWVVDAAGDSQDAQALASALPRGPVYSSGAALAVADQLPTADPQHAKLVAYQETFAKYNNGLRPNVYAAVAADATRFIITGLREDGGIGGPDLAQAIANGDETLGLYSMYHFSPQRHNGAELAGTVVRLQRDGSLEYVETLPPDESAQDTETATAVPTTPVTVPNALPSEVPSEGDTDNDATSNSTSVAVPLPTPAATTKPRHMRRALPKATPQPPAYTEPTDNDDYTSEDTQSTETPSQTIPPPSAPGTSALPSSSLPAAPPPDTSTPVPIDTE